MKGIIGIIKTNWILIGMILTTVIILTSAYAQTWWYPSTPDFIINETSHFDIGIKLNTSTYTDDNLIAQNVLQLGNFSSGTYWLSGNWASAAQTMTASSYLKNFTINFTGFDQDHYIDRIEIVNSSNSVSMANFTGGLAWNSTLLNDVNLTNYYQFENNANDFKNNKSFTTSQGTITVGKFSNAYTYNGAQRATVTGCGINGSQSFTMMAWVKPTASMTNFAGAVSFGDAVPHKSAYIGMYGNGLNKLGVGFYGNNMQAGITPTINVWYHLAMVYNGTNHMSYVNGVLTNTSATYTAANIDCTDATGVTNIGAIADGGYYWTGVVDDAAIFKRVLTTDEILQLYKNTNKQTTLFINNSYLSSGNLTNVDDNFKIRTYLKGNGTSTPVINDITGYYETPAIPLVITIQLPTNTTYCSGGNFAWNITTDSPGVAGEWCGVSLNGGANSTMTNATGNWYADSSSISSGNYNSKFCCNNTENTETCVDINYTVLNIPTITIQLPANTTYCNNTLWFNATLNYDVSSCSYSIDNLDNDTLTNSTGNWNDYRDMDFDYCDHNVTFYCNQSTCTATSYSEANPIYTTPIRRFWSCYVGGGTSNEDGALLILPFLLALIMGFLYIKLRDLVKYMDILFSGLALVFVMIGITMLAGYGGDATLTSMLTDYKIILIWLFVGMMFALLLYAVYQAFQMWKPKSFKDNYEK
jgi:hypothetical protein